MRQEGAKNEQSTIKMNALKKNKNILVLRTKMHIIGHCSEEKLQHKTIHICMYTRCFYVITILA